MTRRLAQLLAPALVVTSLVAGCGGGDGAAAPQAATNATAPSGEGERTTTVERRDAEAESARSDTSEGDDHGDEADSARERDRPERTAPPESEQAGGDEDAERSERSGGTGAASGDRRREIESFLEDYLARYSRRDASICTEVFTQRHVEALTRRKGEAAVAKCRGDISTNRTSFRLHELQSVQGLARDRWRVVAVLAVGNRGYRSALELTESRGRLRIDGAG